LIREKKTEEAIARKLRILSNDGKTEIQQAVKQVHDTLRYKVVFEFLVYKRQVDVALVNLEQIGFKIVSIINYWMYSAPEQGVYATIKSDPKSGENGFTFEIEFHTPDSLETQEKKVDEVISKLHESKTQAAVEAVYKEVEQVWNLVKVPPAAKKIVWPLAQKSCVIS